MIDHFQMQFARKYLKKFRAGSCTHDESEEELKGLFREI